MRSAAMMVFFFWGAMWATAFEVPTSRLQGSKPRKAVDVGAMQAAISVAVATGMPLMAVAEAPGWVEPTRVVLSPVLFVVQFMFLCRILLSWYPEINVNKLPYNLVAWPTEPVLRATRSVVPPAFGVDISPVIWIALANLAQELLLGQQGVLVLMSRS